MIRIFFIICFFVINDINAQTYKLIIIDDNKTAIDNANVFILNEKSGIHTSGFSDDEGFFSFEYHPNKKYSVQVLKPGFDLFMKEFTSDPSKPLVTITLTTRVESLEEILLNAEKSIKRSKDTTTYRVSNFADGSERVVEDLLENLPGLEVKQDGSITYQGNSISNVLINGKKLFNLDYKEGTQNISSNVVEYIQVIENYSDNKLFADYKTDRIALNIQTKKSTVTTLRSSLGKGFNDEVLADANLLWSTQSVATFSKMGYQNVGEYKFQRRDADQNNSIDNTTGNLTQLGSDITIDATGSPFSLHGDLLNDEFKIQSNAFMQDSTMAFIKTSYVRYSDSRSRSFKSRQNLLTPTNSIDREVSTTTNYVPNIDLINIEHLFYPRKNQSINYTVNAKLERIERQDNNITNGISNDYKSQTRDRSVSVNFQHLFLNEKSQLDYYVSLSGGLSDVSVNNTSNSINVGQDIEYRPLQLNVGVNYQRKFGEVNVLISPYGRNSSNHTAVNTNDNRSKQLVDYGRGELGTTALAQFTKGAFKLQLGLEPKYVYSRESAFLGMSDQQNFRLLPQIKLETKRNNLLMGFNYSMTLDYLPFNFGFNEQLFIGPNNSITYRDNNTAYPVHTINLLLSESAISKTLEWRSSAYLVINDKSRIYLNDFEADLSRTSVISSNKNTYSYGVNGTYEKYIGIINGNLLASSNFSENLLLNVFDANLDNILTSKIRSVDLSVFYKRRFLEHWYLKSGVESRYTQVTSENENSTNRNFNLRVLNSLKYKFGEFEAVADYTYLRTRQGIDFDWLNFNLEWSPNNSKLRLAIKTTNLFNRKSLQTFYVSPTAFSLFETQLAGRRVYIKASYNF
jgi:hypothetical protein